jgi:hypothetical protein
MEEEDLLAELLLFLEGRPKGFPIWSPYECFEAADKLRAELERPSRLSDEATKS